MLDLQLYTYNSTIYLTTMFNKIRIQCISYNLTNNLIVNKCKYLNLNIIVNEKNNYKKSH